MNITPTCFINKSIWPRDDSQLALPTLLGIAFAETFLTPLNCVYGHTFTYIPETRVLVPEANTSFPVLSKLKFFEQYPWLVSSTKIIYLFAAFIIALPGIMIKSVLLLTDSSYHEMFSAPVNENGEFSEEELNEASKRSTIDFSSRNDRGNGNPDSLDENQRSSDAVQPEENEDSETYGAGVGTLYSQSNAMRNGKN